MELEAKYYYIATQTDESIRLEGPHEAEEIDLRYFEIEGIEQKYPVRVHAFNQGEAMLKVICHLLNRERVHKLFPNFTLNR